MPQAMITECAELTPLASFYRPMRHWNSRLIHQSAKHVRETAVASAGFAIKGAKNRRFRIVADRNGTRARIRTEDRWLGGGAAFGQRPSMKQPKAAFSYPIAGSKNFAT